MLVFFLRVVLPLAIAAVAVVVVWAIFRLINNSKYQSALNNLRDAKHEEWANGELVKGAVTNYQRMVTKHGPDSDEAKAFRFQMDDSIMADLHGGEPAVKAFQASADIIDSTWRGIHGRKA